MGHNDDHPAPVHSAYPPPGQAYPPPQGSEYPPPGQAYPSQPPPGQAYPPQPPQYQPYPAPPPPQQAAYYPPNPQAPPPAGYPPVPVDHGHQQPPATNTQNKGDGFLKGCAAAICCCFAFEICCD